MEETLILDESHPVISKILSSTKIDDETRLIAVGALNALEQNDKLWPHPENAEDVDDLFEWDDSDLGSKFWENIQDKVFAPEKRTC